MELAGSLDQVEVAILVAAALATSILSAIVGMAGGITLLSVMLLFLPPLAVIPLHGVVQLVSNSSRTVIQRRHLRWDIIARYGVLLLPMGVVGLQIVRHLPESALKVAIGIFVLVATWLPRFVLLGAHPERSDPRKRFFALGGVVGVLNIAIGATGPLIAPFFLNLGLSRFQLIGTKAGCQTLGHLVKIAIFGVAGFAFLDYGSLLSLLCVAVVFGTWIGSRLLDHVNEVWFVRLYKAVLSLIALRLVVGELGVLTP